MAARARTSRSGGVRHAFTIVEILVVLVIMSVLAALVVPRLFNSGERQALVESKSVAALLTAAAQRDALSSQPLAIVYDAELRQLRLEVLGSEKEDEDGTAPADWIPAPLVQPVTLTTAELREALADGRAMAVEKNGAASAKGAVWRIELGRSDQRPSVTLQLVHTGGLSTDRAWQIDLLPGELASRWREVDPSGGPVAPDTRSEDLDSAGKREHAW